MIHDLFFFPFLGSFPPEPLRGFTDAEYRLSVQLHPTAFLAKLLFAEGRILQEMHFKPADQARRPTFASEKANRRGRRGNRSVLENMTVKKGTVLPDINAGKKVAEKVRQSSGVYNRKNRRQSGRRLQGESAQYTVI